MTKPILQLMPAPYRLRRAAFANAYSPTNSEGSFAAAYALRSLVDPIPLPKREYFAGGSCEQTYGDILLGADGGGDSSFATLLIENSRKTFKQAALSTLSITPSEWRAVDALPDGWMHPWVEGFEKAIYHPKTHELTGLGVQFQTLGQGKATALQISNGETSRPALAATEVEKITISVLTVNIRRPWMDLTLFKTKGWSLPGQSAGFVSNGKPGAANTGVLPMVVTALLVGQTTSVSANLAEEDKAFLASGKLSEAVIGPFSFPLGAYKAPNTTDADPELYLFGVISQVIPFSP